MVRREMLPRVLKRAVLMIPMALVLAGCNVWTMYGGDATHSSYDSSNVITTSDVATLANAGTTAPATGTNSAITSSPTVASNGMLYATVNYTDPSNPPGTTTGELYAYPADGGTTNCPTPTQGHPTLNCQPVWTAIPSEVHGLTTSPAVDTSLSTPVVYVGGKGGVVYAYNASNGSLLWRSQTLGGSIDGSLTVANGYVYVPEDYGWVYVFPSTTGTDGSAQNCWWDGVLGVTECDADWGYSTGGNNLSTPTVANGMLYQAAGDHIGGSQDNPNQYAVYAFNASYNTSECTGTYAPHEYNLPLADIATCRPAWSAPWLYGGGWDGGASSPAVANGDVYIESADSGLLAYSANGSSHCSGTPYMGQWGALCTPVWVGATGKEYSNGGAGLTGPTPAVANGIVYIGDKTGEIYAFNATTGSLIWSYATHGTIDSSVAVAGDSASDAVAFVGCSNALSGSGQTCSHSLFAFNAASGGSPLWTANTGGSIDNPPIIADKGAGSGTGAVYVASGNQLFPYSLNGNG
jgi:eukaryotic-like serine/threonine-protein kinase